MNRLHKIQEWEANNPGYTFEHVFYTEKSNEVRKITGTVTVLKPMGRLWPLLFRHSQFPEKGL